MTKPIPGAAFGRPQKHPVEKRVSVSYRFHASSARKLAELAYSRRMSRTAILENLIEQASIQMEADNERA